MKRILSFSICIIMVICLLSLPASASDVLKDADVSLEESMQTFYKNPGRGYAHNSDDCYHYVAKNGKIYDTEGHVENISESMFSGKGIYTPMFMLAEYSAGNDYINPNEDDDERQNGKAKHKVGGVNKDIDKETLDAIEEVFRCIQANGAVCIPRFNYDYHGYMGMEPDDINQICRHIDQICEILNRYKGTVISIEAGMIGPYGEMWGSMYKFESIAFKNGADIIMKEWDDKLDPSIMIQVRYMGYIIMSTDMLPVKFAKDFSVIKGTMSERMGLFNDGYLGSDTDIGSFVHDDEFGYKMPRASAIAFVKYQGDKVPYGGELAYVDSKKEMIDEGSIIFKGNVLTKELYDSHLTYLRNIPDNITSANALRDLTFTKEEHWFDGMPDVSPYYGQTMQKFIMDHMGYRFMVRSAMISSSVKKGGKVTIKGKVENTGFSNIYFDAKTELVIIGPDGEKTVINTNIDTKKWKSATTSDYFAMISVPTDAKAGTYKVYIRSATNASGVLKKDNLGTIAFANKDMYDSTLGANYIGSFEVADESSGETVDEFRDIVDRKFTDVADASWYNEAVYYSVANGLFSGMTPTTFEPETPTSRAMLVKVLHNLEGQPDVSGLDNPFTDVKAGDWYEKAVIWAFHNNITSGMTETTFGPSLNITREQFAAFLYRYAGYKGVDTSKENSLSAFTDAGDISSYAVKPLAWANREGFITGMTNTILNPKGNATRAQMASILMRYTRAYG